MRRGKSRRRYRGPFGQYIRSAPRKPVQVGRPANPKGKPETETAPAEATGGPGATGGAVGGTGTGADRASPSPPSTELLGLDPQHTKELLGPATQTRSRSSGHGVALQTGRCELDISFYMEMKSGQMRALHYDFKGEADSPEQRQACLDRLSRKTANRSAFKCRTLC